MSKPPKSTPTPKANCCSPQTERLYAAETMTGHAVYCCKCGTTRAASLIEIDRITATGGAA